MCTRVSYLDASVLVWWCVMRGKQIAACMQPLRHRACGSNHPPSQPLCIMCLINVSRPSIQSVDGKGSRSAAGTRGRYT